LGSNHLQASTTKETIFKKAHQNRTPAGIGLVPPALRSRTISQTSRQVTAIRPVPDHSAQVDHIAAKPFSVSPRFHRRHPGNLDPSRGPSPSSGLLSVTPQPTPQAPPRRGDAGHRPRRPPVVAAVRSGANSGPGPTPQANRSRSTPRHNMDSDKKLCSVTHQSTQLIRRRSIHRGAATASRMTRSILFLTCGGWTSGSAPGPCPGRFAVLRFCWSVWAAAGRPGVTVRSAMKLSRSQARYSTRRAIFTYRGPAASGWKEDSTTPNSSNRHAPKLRTQQPERTTRHPWTTRTG
jgi:hypothetical protein